MKPVTAVLLCLMMACDLQPAASLDLGNAPIPVEIVEPENTLSTDEETKASSEPTQGPQPDHIIPESSDAIPSPPDSGYAHAATGAFLLASGDLLGAIVELRHALRLQPDYVKARADLGSALYQTGDIDSAVETYREALHLEPDFVQSRMSLATALMVKHEWGQAQDELQTVIMLQPTLAQAYDNLGVVRYTMGNHAGAIKAYRQALELRPDYADAHYRLGLVLTLMNRNTEASSEYVAAATAGLPRAQYFAGAAYASGVGVTRNLATALQWWFQAAEQEVAEAKEALSEMRRVALLTDAHSPEERRATLQAFEDFRHELWTQFPDRNKSAGDGSVGAGLLQQGRIQEGLMMLIREAYALSESAHTLLETLYERGVEGDLAPYDRRIFAYVKATAEEGLPRPRLTLARMYVRGLGVPQDLPKTISLLKDVSGESAMELMNEISGMQKISPQAAPKTTSIR